MIDLGINRVQDVQGSLPGVQSAQRVQGDRSREQPKGDAVAASKSSEEAAAEKEKEIQRVDLTPEELKREVKQLNQLLGGNRSLQFRVNEETEKIRIEIVDTRSGKVIRTVPPSEIKNVESRLRSGNLLIDDVS